MAVFPEDCGTGEDMQVDRNMQTIQSGDSDPTLQVLNYSHDNIGIMFDAYYSGGWKSSDAGSNFRVYKISDVLRISYASGVTKGNTISAWASADTNVAISVDSSGKVGIKKVSPSTELDVNGTVLADYVKMNERSNPPTNSIYVDSTSHKLRFKDKDGVSHDLY